MIRRRLTPFATRLFACVVLVLVLGLAAWFGRGYLRATWRDLTRPPVPEAVGYHPVAAPVSVTSTRPVPTNPATTTAPTPKPELKAAVNLAVPFLLQAPKQNWEQPYGDACEEASLIMVDAYYRGRTSDYDPDEGIAAIDGIVAFEDRTYGYNKDTTSEDVAQSAREYFGYPNVRVTEATESGIKEALNLGYPVIVPAHGKALKNPNFRNGGPEYHMLVIKGYTRDGSWITNDPGTRHGKDYVYAKQLLLDAIHDFDAEDMRQGRKLMIVIRPE